MKKYLFFFVFCFGLMAGQQDNPFYGDTHEADKNVTQDEGRGPGAPPGLEEPVPIDTNLWMLIIIALAATYYYGRRLHLVQSKD